ncbi:MULTISPECIES: carbohydrate ABC transporter permease [Terrabacteria group]|uniref:carbohydrate ABC transporter permease n=1 Tax=Bacillati TaxID=1783272 RepID=UPI00193A021B|nr:MULTISPECIES: carbohydrate ABC transporter permease [Terrabacteria group]MBW9212181.1 carbohydrate ABC transporter permease [Trueperella sp. zg.1013]QRG86274.1 carbohydrate ABC transporter permease [Bulleidia sp. zg-1006]
MKKDIKISKMIRIVCLVVFSLLFLAPYFWMLSNSFKSTSEILLEPQHLLPTKFTLAGYIKVLTKSPFFRWLLNSLFITIIDTVVILFTSSIIGFVLSKYRFKLRKTMFYIILLTMMVPATAMMIPNFLLISTLGWYDKLIALIVPTFFNAFGIFLCKQYIDDLPKELFESAMLDNASDLKIYFKIVLPSIKPAIGSLAIFTFLALWNDYLTPLIMLNSAKNMTLPLALSFFSAQHMSDLSATMAAASLIMIPASAIFILFQNQFIKGITMSGMK